jgi:protein gp37
MPSLLWAGSMSELLLPGRPKEVLDRTIGTLALSDHIGLILAKPTHQMAAYINAQRTIVQRRWRTKFWLGFSAEDQTWFDLRWPPMRNLAQRGWLVFVSIAPMLGPVILPQDFLTMARWVICSGEEGPQEHVRYMKHTWPRAVRDQCAAARLPFFMRQMAGKKPIPPDLLIRQFPLWPR